MIAAFLRRIGYLLRRAPFDDSLAEEMRLHCEERAGELMASGMPAEEAMAAAQREFGRPSRIAEESRDAWRFQWLEDFARDLRHAARALGRERSFAAAAILSLALGIGLNTTIFSLTAEYLFSRPSVREPDRMVRAIAGGSTSIPMREYRFLRDTNTFAQLAGSNEMQEANWRAGDASRRVFVTRVTENFFEVTGMSVALGRPPATGERGVVVISHGFWRSRLHGDPAVVGRPLVLDGAPWTVVGILPETHRSLTGFSFVPDLYQPIENENGRVALYGRLAADDTPGAAGERWKAACARLDQVFPDPNRSWSSGVLLIGLVGIERLNEGFLRTLAAFFGLLMAAAGLLLLIACSNVAGLLLARSAARAHDFAIRMSIGAGRGRLIRQVLAESLLLSTAGTAAGLFLNYALTRILNQVSLAAPFPMRIAIEPDTRLAVYAAVIAVASSLLAGLYPALRSARAGENLLLKSAERQVSGRGARSRNVLVAGQLALSVLMLVIAALSVRNLIQSARLETGFDLQNTVWAQMRLVPEGYREVAKVRSLVRNGIEKLRAAPGVTAATAAAVVPLNDHFLSRSRVISTDSGERGTRLEHAWNAVGPDYFRTMGIRLIAGREFDARDTEGGSRVVILNETLARLAFGGANPVGRRIRLGSEPADERTVIGVAANSKYSTIGEKDRPAVYESWFQFAGRGATVQFLVRAPAAARASVRGISAALLDADRSAAVETKPMSEATAFALMPSRIGAALLGSIGLLGLSLAAVGLYGVLAYSITQRTREIGLRVAVGASRGDVVKLVARQEAWILGPGLGIGFLLGAVITKPLTRFLTPGIAPLDPAAYGMVAAVLFAVGCAAGWNPVRRALRIDPVTALREE